ncbi:MAG: hypothetical protein F4044_09790 [Rhodobacteraceae bacterium]|nr:hypothetical protein [Paracoccaceae bacterium]
MLKTDYSHDQIDQVDDNHWQERVDLAAAFRWSVKMNFHEAVANHFSLAVNESGTKFLINPNQVHFSNIRASNLLLVDVNDPETMNRPDCPDPTAWGLHGALHRLCPHARCAIHLHPIYSTVLASLEDSSLPPVDQNAAMFFNRVIIDEDYGGLAFEEEGNRCAALFSDPKKQVMVMGNHGLLVIGQTVADTFDRTYLFERAAGNYIRALQTGQKLRVMPDHIAEKVASAVENYPGLGQKHFDEIKVILDREEPDYAT